MATEKQIKSSSSTTKRVREKEGKRRERKKIKDTYIDDPVLGIVGVGTADVKAGSISHRLDNSNVIAAIVKLVE